MPIPPVQYPETSTYAPYTPAAYKGTCLLTYYGYTNETCWYFVMNLNQFPLNNLKYRLTVGFQDGDKISQVVRCSGSTTRIEPFYPYMNIFELIHYHSEYFFHIRYDTKDDRHDYGKVDRMLGSGNKQVRNWRRLQRGVEWIDHATAKLQHISAMRGTQK